MRATHATVRSLTRRVKGVGHKLYMDNFFSSPDIFDDLYTRVIKCSNVRQNRKIMPRVLDDKALKLIWSNIYDRVRDNLPVTRQGDVHILTYMHRPQAKGNFCEEHWKPKKNLSLLQTKIGIGTTLTKGTEWLLDIQSENMVVEKRSFLPLGPNYTE
jgi:hypothetical protein